ncbi:MAG: hypothetical protein Ct9H300mP12_15810 [Acidimicrobiales bacterium]|nr:MAG: hypothetical protein Ct9H300mP12_15810 [Acidimicrobiales bacterium]
MVVMSDTRAAELGLKPLARIVSSGVSALAPKSWASDQSGPSARPSAGPA